MRGRLLSSMLGLALLVTSVTVAAPATAGASVASAVSPSRRWVGFYQPGAPQSTSTFQATEWTARAQARVVSYYQDVPASFSVWMASQAAAVGATPMITLELWEPGKGVNQSGYSMSSVIAGDWDAYFEQYAKDAKAYGGPVWLRIFHEMNGNWYPWCGRTNGNTPAECVAAWKHIYNIFKAQGATNVKFVWCPNRESIPLPSKDSGNAIKKYWPGSSYVDIMAIDGFNFASYFGMRWLSFKELFAEPYDDLTDLSSSKPIIVAETGCTNKGGDKAEWISDMFTVIPKKFPRIVGVVWFNAKKEVDWRVNSSSSARSAFVEGSQASSWINKTTTTASIKTSKKKTKRKRTFTLSGSLKNGESGDRIRLYVKRPGSKTWKLVSKRTLSKSKTWSYRYKPGYKGTYRFRVKYLGDYTRKTDTSRTIKVKVRK